MTSKAEIQRGLDAWAVLIQNSRHSTNYMVRADAARRAQETTVRKRTGSPAPGLGKPRPAAD